VRFVPYSPFLCLLWYDRNRENYIHRIGRSGRFGRKGVAINVRYETSAPWIDVLTLFISF
jgi:superfamily II DNA/RNA helicase